MIRHLALVALALVVSAPAAPAAAQDDLARQLIDTCIGCRLPKDLRGRDLHGLRFVGTNLRDADLARADLSGAYLVGTSLRNARLAGATLGDAVLCSDNRGDDSDRRTACADLRGVDLHGVDLRAVRHCTSDGRDNQTCRTVTRRELIDDAHADLTGAQAPA